MNDLVLNLLPMAGNRQSGTVSSAMNRATFNAVCFDSGRRIQATSSSVAPSIPQFFGAPPTGGGGWTGSGITGTYYSHSDYTGTSFQRTDVRIDMPPTTVLPGGSLATDPVFGAVGATNFSVKWIGSLIPKYTEIYTLKIKTGGTLTLKIGGSTVATATSSGGWVSASYPFTSGTSYAVEVDYVQGTGPWSAQVHWLSSGAIPFLEEAISPATPIGVNLGNEDQDCPANGGLVANYETGLDSGSGPPLDSSGWPTGDFAFNQMSSPNNGNSSYSFPNVGFASDGRTGVWTISFSGSAELYTNNTGQFLIGHNDGSRTSVALNSLTYYSYNQDLPLSAQVYHSGTGTGYNPATNMTVALLDLRSGGWDNIGFRSTDRLGQGAPGGPSGSPHANGITNVVCMRPSSIGSTTSLAPGTIIYPPYLAACAPYTCLRNLGTAYNIDFVASVASPYTDWNKRNTPVFNKKVSDGSQYTSNPTTLPWEIRILTCNLSGKDLHVSIPQTASGNASDSDYTSSYIYQLANLIKNGITYNGVVYPGLLPHLCVYIEYGNEDWNASSPVFPDGGAGNTVYAGEVNRVANTNDWQQYVAMGGYYTTDSNGHVNYLQNATWNALKIKDASDLFRIVYGDAAMPGGPAGYNPDPRIRPIFEFQYGASYGGFGGVAEAFNRIYSHSGMPLNHIYWGGGGSWYMELNPGDSTADAIYANITQAQAIAYWTNSFFPAGYANGMQVDMSILAQYGLHHVGYEGGFEFGDGGTHVTSAQQQACNDSRIIPYVQLALNGYFQSGGSLPIVFTSTGGPYGFAAEWAVIDGIWDGPPYAAAPPKLQAYLNSQAALPAAPVAPSAWITAPGDFSLSSSYGNGWGQNFNFVVTTPGNYSVGFVVSGPNTYATGTMTLYVDGTSVGSLTTTNTSGGQSLWVPLYLGAAVHNARIFYSNENPSNTQISLSRMGVR